MRLTFVLAAAALALPLAAQNPRAAVNLHGCTEITFDPQVATQGDVSVAAISAGDSGLGLAHIEVYRSDGRGLSWSGPVQVDLDGSGARKDLDDPSYLQIDGGRVYLIWEDQRGATNDVYFSCSTDGGASWALEILLDKPAGHGDTFNARMAVSGNDIYIAYEANEPGGSDDQLQIVASHDGGLTFGSAVNPSVGGGPGTLVDVDNFMLMASGTTVHVAWTDDRVAGTNGVFYQRSTDGGATFLLADVQLDAGTGDATSGPVNMAQDGSLLAVGWEYETTGAGFESLFVATSTDSGATFGAGVLVGAYTDVTDDVDASRLMTSGGNLIAVWEDNRTGSDEIFVATSTDSGATWTEQAASFGAGGFPRVSNVSSGSEDGVAIGWTGPSFPESALYAVSTDNGVTFGSALSVSDDTPSDVDFAEVKWNDLYNNYICAWQAEECTSDGGITFFNNTFVGGFRPQSIAANGFVAGPTTVDFDVSNFDTGTTQVWVVCSLATGDTFIPFGDGRNVGLVQDGLFAFTTNVPGAFNTTLDASGSGTTTSQAVTLAAGTTVFAVGVGLNPVNPPTFGDVSDILQIDIP